MSSRWCPRSADAARQVTILVGTVTCRPAGVPPACPYPASSGGPFYVPQAFIAWHFARDDSPRRGRARHGLHRPGGRGRVHGDGAAAPARARHAQRARGDRANVRLVMAANGVMSALAARRGYPDRPGRLVRLRAAPSGVHRSHRRRAEPAVVGVRHGVGMATATGRPYGQRGRLARIPVLAALSGRRPQPQAVRRRPSPASAARGGLSCLAFSGGWPGGQSGRDACSCGRNSRHRRRDLAGRAAGLVLLTGFAGPRPGRDPDRAAGPGPLPRPLRRRPGRYLLRRVPGHAHLHGRQHPVRHSRLDRAQPDDSQLIVYTHRRAQVRAPHSGPAPGAAREGGQPRRPPGRGGDVRPRNPGRPGGLLRRDRSAARAISPARSTWPPRRCSPSTGSRPARSARHGHPDHAPRAGVAPDMS